MILSTSDFIYLTFFKFHKLLTYTILYFQHDPEKTIPKKAPKRVERVECSSAKKRTRSPSNEEEEESDGRSTKDRRTKRIQRVERVERSSLKKHARTPSDEEEEESDERNKKERRSNKNKLANTT